MSEPRGRQTVKRLADSLAMTRTVRTSELFGMGYASTAASIYIGLGVVASYALGLTPLIFLIVGVAFAITLMVYVEGAAMYPERGGSSLFARHAFNELVSFVAGWAILLDYIIVMALAAFTVPHYFEAFSDQFSKGAFHMPVSLAVIVGVVVINIRGIKVTAWRRAARFSFVDIGLLVLIVVVGLAVVWDPSALTREIDLGTMPDWQHLVYALAIATLAYIGIEAATNLSPEVRFNRVELTALVSISSLVTLASYVGIALVALMALPIHAGPGSLSLHSEAFLEAPVLAIVMAMDAGILSEILRYAVGIVAPLILIQAASASMVGVSGLAYSLATNRQLPSSLARLHPARSTPYVAIAVAGVLAAVLLIPDSLNFLLSIYAFGAMISIMVANAAIFALRIKQPEQPRGFKMPLNIKVGGREIQLLALVGTLTAAVSWLAVVIYRPGARWVGLAWLLSGILLYITYRLSSGKSLTKRVTVEPEALKEAPAVAFGNILVPVFGSPLDDDIVGTAGRLAAEQKEGRFGSLIEAMYPLVVPVSLPLDAELPPEQIEQANRALARAKEIAEEYSGVTVATTLIRTRSAGAAICEEARRRNVEVIVVGGEKPSLIAGGSILGGVASRGTPFVGPTTEYVLRRAPCQVILTAPPEDADPGAMPAAGPRSS